MQLALAAGSRREQDVAVLSSGVIGGLIASLVVGLVAGAKGRLPRVLFPIGVAVLCFGMSAFFFYVYFFVGSSRPDAEVQMRYCLGLAIAFLIGSVVVPVCTFWAARAR
jgi:hypothetical protein